MQNRENNELAKPLLWVLLVVLAARLVQLAVAKPFWHDEFYSLAMGRVPLSRAWEAMTSGFEFNPPLTYLVMRATEQTIGQGELFARLPFMVAGLASCGLIFAYFSCAGQHWRGLLAACLYVQSVVGEYFIDARIYSFVLMALGCCLVGWRRRVVLEEQGWWPLVLVSFGTFAMTIAHFWSLGILLAFGVAEFARAVIKRRVDWTLWLVVFVSMVPVLGYPLLLSTFVPYVLQYGAYRHNLPGAYLEIIGWSLLSACAAGIPVTVHRLMTGRFQSIEWPSFTRPELALMIAFAVLPVILYVATWFMAGLFMTRYAMWACIPVVFIAAMLLDSVTENHNYYQYYSLVVLVLGAGVFTTTWSGRPGQQDELDWQTLNLDGLEGGLDIVVGSGMHFLSIHHYASEELKSRVFKVVVPELALKLLGSGLEDGAIVLGASHLNVAENILEVSEFRARQEPFYFVDYPGWLQKTDWFSSANFELVEGFPSIYRVSFPGTDK
jgi:hypothetical protein